jgi:ABC-type multidrug transport system ATPase subunit
MNSLPAIKAIQIEKKFESGGFEFDWSSLTFNRRPEKMGLHKTTLEIPRGSLVAVLGPSGCGKSTLLKALNGDSPATSGKVWLNGLELNEDNIDFIKTHIGYVPQDDIIHNELTVESSLMYAAHLRLMDFSIAEKRNKVNEVLRTLNIEDIRKKRIKKISGGQRKRVAIAMEILTDPSILFLDEPTSPLDPQTIEEFLKILQNLARNGTTVLMVTHKPEDLFYMDKAIFMSVGGNICFYGNADEYLSYFGVKNAIEVYSMLSEEKSKPWILKYNKELRNERIEIPSLKKPTVEEPNYFFQFFWLTIRNMNIKINDLGSFLIMIGQAPIIALLLCFIFDSISQVVPFFMSISAVWFGVNNASREIVVEQFIYKRERMFNLGIFSYLFSKITVLGIIALIQAVLFTAIMFYRYKTGFVNYQGLELTNPIGVISWMTFLTLISTMMGLLISSSFSNTDKVMSFVPIVLIPQIMLAGVIVKIKYTSIELLSYLTLSRWGTTGFAKIQENISIPKPEIKPGTGIFMPNGEFIIPVPQISTKEDSTVNAVKEISSNFLNSAKGNFQEYSNNINLEIIILTGISIVFFIALYLSMKTKDTINIRN